MKSVIGSLVLLFSIIFILGEANVELKAQNQEKPRISPKAEVMQVVGFTEVRIYFGRPGVKNRTIWGELVPYNSVWRAGANEATKFTFSTDVIIEGKKLPAGSYSFFAIPGKENWTLIFNRVADQWGAFEYNEAEDALRITVKPKNSGFTEWLDYNFKKLSDNSAEISLDWERLKIPFKIEVEI
ncbi:MAG: DUF2911 domain-containing protein [Ignavibacteriaceae bacterium]